MDIIDIILARALSAQGSIEQYAALAQKAVTEATSAVNNIESITEQTNANNEAAAEALANLNEILEGVSSQMTETADAEIDKLVFSLYSSNGTNLVERGITATYPDNDATTIDVVKMYKSYGTNEDGTMTQKAIKSFVDGINSSLDARITALENAGGGGGGGEVPSWDPDHAGFMTAVNKEGKLDLSYVRDADVIRSLIKNNSFLLAAEYYNNLIYGVEIDYVNKTVRRIYSGTDGISFDAPGLQRELSMYTGRMRCNVNDNGAITAFYGDNNYIEDGSNGQVMVLQLPFYYLRTPLSVDYYNLGQIIRKEILLISYFPLPGFIKHPLFENKDYVLLSAYEGSLYDVSSSTYVENDNVTADFTVDMLSSIANVRPACGENNNLTSANAERIARNRGPGWHITNMAYESAMQMLFAVEYATLNSQTTVGKGIVNLPSGSYAAYTGSTSSLGNTTGRAQSTSGGGGTVYTAADQTAITYRGVENAWGNLWRWIGGARLYGNGSMAGGEVQIGASLDWSQGAEPPYWSWDTTAPGVSRTGMYLPSTYNWISGFGYHPYYNDIEYCGYDWAFVPVECSSSANSAVPVGDNLWSTENLNGYKDLTAGGMYRSGDSAGLFFYGGQNPVDSHYKNTGARLIHIPWGSEDSNNTYKLNMILLHSRFPQFFDQT